MNLVHITFKANDFMDKYAIGGIVAVLLFQQVQNISMTIGLLPIMGITLPFISTSSILRGYFFGKEKMIPHVLSNVVEDIARMLLLYFGWFLP